MLCAEFPQVQYINLSEIVNVLKVVAIMYSQTSPYRHLLTDTSIIWTALYYGQFVWSQKCQKSYIPYLYNTDTSIERTLGSAPLVSIQGCH